MRLADFDYDLPPELIAQTPLQHRSDSRLLVADPIDQSILHSSFEQITQFLQPGDVLVFNNSKVLPARLYGVKRQTGAKVELLLVKPIQSLQWVVMAKPAKRLHIGDEVDFSNGTEVVVTAVVTAVLEEGLRQVQFHLKGGLQDEANFEQLLEQIGTMPLPPYIQAPLSDQTRYQTVYATTPGSVAAPTAGLHFTDELLQKLSSQGVESEYVTLHVGLGTFRPVQVESIDEHVMHSETYQVSEQVAAAVNKAKAQGRRIIAVGTTALRTLESAGSTGTLVAGSGDTDIFIYPGYRFQMVDGLITNFHLPKSTLLMLVATLIGMEFMQTIYQEAVRERYRFFSFGDAMFIPRRLSQS